MIITTAVAAHLCSAALSPVFTSYARRGSMLAANVATRAR